MVREGRVKLRTSTYWKADWDSAGFYSEALNETFTSKEDKRQKMAKHGVMEAV